MMDIKAANVGQISSIDTMLSPKELFLFGMQHIAAMCAGAMAVPIILGNSLGMTYDQISILVAASFMMAGLGTIIQTLGIGKKIRVKTSNGGRSKFCRSSSSICCRSGI